MEEAKSQGRGPKVMEEAKVVADLEIKILDSSNSSMTRNNSSHTHVVEEASLKAGGAKEDVVIGIDNSQEQTLVETAIIVANQVIGSEIAERSIMT